MPDLLPAIKSELYRDRRPGRFVLAGSARHDAVPELADFLTGRVELLRLWPFAMAELEPGGSSVVDRLFSGVPPARRSVGRDRAELVAIVLHGGYPIAVRLTDAARDRWFANLATLVVERVSDDVTAVRNIAALGRFLRLAAGLLELVYLTVELPAWSTNLTARVSKRPKLHLVDSGLAAHLQGVTAGADRSGAARFDPLLETFVVTEVIKALGWSSVAAQPFHYRTADGAEVDLMLEAADGRVTAIEVKAGTALTPTAIKGLRHLRDRLGDRFVAGWLLNTGTQAQRVDDRIAVAPIDELWATG